MKLNKIGMIKILREKYFVELNNSLMKSLTNKELKIELKLRGEIHTSIGSGTKEVLIDRLRGNVININNKNKINPSYWFNSNKKLSFLVSEEEDDEWKELFSFPKKSKLKFCMRYENENENENKFENENKEEIGIINDDCDSLLHTDNEWEVYLSSNNKKSKRRGQRMGTRGYKFEAYREDISSYSNTKNYHQNVCSYECYSNKSFDELRFEDQYNEISTIGNDIELNSAFSNFSSNSFISLSNRSRKQYDINWSFGNRRRDKK
eukprot:347161_1